MNVRQSDIARACKLDVSSVNKILNDVPGPVFKQITIRRVRAMARRMGYRPKASSKVQIRKAAEALLRACREARVSLEQGRVDEARTTLVRAIFDATRAGLLVSPKAISAVREARPC